MSKGLINSVPKMKTTSEGFKDPEKIFKMLNTDKQTFTKEINN